MPRTWAYKSDKEKSDKERESTSREELEINRFLLSLVEQLNSVEHDDDVLEVTRLDLYSKQVFVFSPKGDLFTLPRGARAIDYAYEVHSKVGDACDGVRINGVRQPLNTVLRNGDRIEVKLGKRAYRHAGRHPRVCFYQPCACTHQKALAAAAQGAPCRLGARDSGAAIQPRRL